LKYQLDGSVHLGLVCSWLKSYDGEVYIPRYSSLLTHHLQRGVTKRSEKQKQKKNKMMAPWLEAIPNISQKYTATLQLFCHIKQ